MGNILKDLGSGVAGGGEQQGGLVRPEALGSWEACRRRAERAAFARAPQDQGRALCSASHST